MKTYKVWIEIEEYDDETDTYEDMDSPFDGEATFDTEEEAQAYALQLHGWDSNWSSAAFWHLEVNNAIN